MQNERIFYMDKAVDLFNTLREEKVSERIDNANLGAMGAVNVQVWTSVLGGTLQYEASNGGCTLRVMHTDHVLEEDIQDGWVACSERMPDGMQTVITSNGFDIGRGWWDGEGWNSFDSHDVVPGEVTQWMPLPAAPQQK